MDEGDVNDGPEEILLKKHRKEKKDLQAKVQSLKKSVTKGDKKKKKDVAAEIEKLESELCDRHKKELDELAEKCKNEVPKTDSVSDAVEQLTIAEEEEPAKRETKAQRRRNKQAERARERQVAIAEQEELNKHGARHLETVAIKKALSERGLRLHEVPSNGDCLYAAVAHQLKLHDIATDVQQLRRNTAQYMLNHSADFLPFLVTSTGECFNMDDLKEYCDILTSKAVWGGQLELAALAGYLKRSLTVIQSEGTPVSHETANTESEPLVLTYHRHMYGLGEHYNSTLPISRLDGAEEDSDS